MATQADWVEGPMNRQQTVLFGPTLDSIISEEDPVRLFDEVLAGLEMMAEAQAADAAEASQSTWDGDDGSSPTQLPGPLADQKLRRERVREALSSVQEADAARSKRGVDPQTHPARVPTTDLDSRVMPNKEGGYAPNYTPTATTDGHRGFIVDCTTLASCTMRKKINTLVRKANRCP